MAEYQYHSHNTDKINNTSTLQAEEWNNLAGDVNNLIEDVQSQSGVVTTLYQSTYIKGKKDLILASNSNTDTIALRNGSNNTVASFRGNLTQINSSQISTLNTDIYKFNDLGLWKTQDNAYINGYIAEQFSFSSWPIGTNPYFFVNTYGKYYYAPYNMDGSADMSGQYNEMFTNNTFYDTSLVYTALSSGNTTYAEGQEQSYRYPSPSQVESLSEPIYFIQLRDVMPGTPISSDIFSSNPGNIYYKLTPVKGLDSTVDVTTKDIIALVQYFKKNNQGPWA